MKSLSTQIPHKSSNRRPKETPSKRSDIDKSVSELQSKIAAKSLSSAFSAAPEDDPLDSMLESAITDENPKKNTLEEISNPSPMDSSEQFDPSVVGIGQASQDLIEVDQNSVGSDGARTENVEVQVAVDFLLRARDQIMNSEDVDLRSKKIVADLIKRVIEPLDLLARETDGFRGPLRAKVYIGLIYLFMCVLFISAVILGDVGTGTDFPNALRPT